MDNGSILQLNCNCFIIQFHQKSNKIIVLKHSSSSSIHLPNELHRNLRRRLSFTQIAVNGVEVLANHSAPRNRPPARHSLDSLWDVLDDELWIY